jgi:hypothetical protein
VHVCLGGECFLAEVGAQSCAPEVRGEAGQRLVELVVWSWWQAAIV